MMKMNKFTGYLTRSYFAGLMWLVVFELGNGAHYPTAMFLVGLALLPYVVWGGEQLPPHICSNSPIYISTGRELRRKTGLGFGC